MALSRFLSRHRNYILNEATAISNGHRLQALQRNTGKISHAHFWKKIHLEAVYFCSEIKDKLAENFFFLRKESLWIVDVEYCACRNVRKRRMDI